MIPQPRSACPINRSLEMLGDRWSLLILRDIVLHDRRSFRELVRRGGRAEIESLNSGDRAPMGMDRPTWRFSVDWQRSCAAGAHQGGVVRVSTELGAQMDKCYDFSLTDYRHMLDKEWALGATR